MGAPQSVHCSEDGWTQFEVGLVSLPPGEPVCSMVISTWQVHCLHLESVSLSCQPHLASYGRQHPGPASHMVDVGFGRVVVGLDQDHSTFQGLCGGLNIASLGMVFCVCIPAR